MNIKAVIFDMDGVIFDTERVSQRAWLAIAEEFGFDTMPDVYPKIIGTNTQGGRNILMAEYGDEKKVDDFLKVSFDKFKDILENEGIPLKAGVRELLTYLTENGYKTALASSTASDIVKNELAQTGLIEYFDFIIGGDMVTHSKPNPEIFLKACEGISVNRNEAIIIEDSHNGIRAAHRAGIFAVMVPDLMPVTYEMKNLTGIILPSLTDVREWIKNHK